MPPSEFKWNRVEAPRLEVSSTDLRERFVDGRPLDYLVSNEVLKVIAERGLYGAEKYSAQKPGTKNYSAEKL